MRTKPVEGVWGFEIGRFDVHPEVAITYDGLSGISQRPVLRDVMDELERKGPAVLTRFIEAMRAHHPGYVHVYFSDYVSYGIGGGDAVAQYFLGRWMLVYEPARSTNPPVPEHLALMRPGGVERLALEGVSGSGSS